MKRLRWLQASWPFSVRTLASKLREYKFGLDSEDGFLVERVRENFIEGKFIEKIAFDEIVRDPFGNEIKYDRLAYREVDFIFSAAYPQVEISNFPRGLQAFISRTSEATNFSTAFSSLKIDPFIWAEAIQKRFPRHFRIDLAQLSDLFVEENITAKVLLSGSSDVRTALEKFTNKRRHTVDKIQVKLEHEGSLLSLLLAADGTLRTLESTPTEVLDVARHALPTSPSEING